MVKIFELAIYVPLLSIADIFLHLFNMIDYLMCVFLTRLPFALCVFSRNEHYLSIMVEDVFTWNHTRYYTTFCLKKKIKKMTYFLLDTHMSGQISKIKKWIMARSCSVCPNTVLFTLDYRQKHHYSL